MFADGAEVGVVDGHAEAGAELAFATESETEVSFGLVVVTDAEVDVAETVEGGDVVFEIGSDSEVGESGIVEGLIVVGGGVGVVARSAIVGTEVV